MSISKVFVKVSHPSWLFLAVGTYVYTPYAGLDGMLLSEVNNVEVKFISLITVTNLLSRIAISLSEKERLAIRLLCCFLIRVSSLGYIL